MTELDVFRIPGSRPIFKSKAERSTRENQWDERFFLGRIPNYDAFKDKHCIGFLLLTSKKKRGGHTPGRIRRIKTPTSSMRPNASRNASTKTFLGTGLRSGVTGPALRELRERLLNIWKSESVPEELWAPWLDTMDAGSLRDRSIFYMKEIDEATRQVSVLQTLTRAIHARELALDQLTKLVRDLQAASARSQITEDVKTGLGNIREVTLEVVEAVALYKERISAMSGMEKRAGKVGVMFRGRNYLLKLKNDLNFLSESPLSSLFSFSEKSDPFLIVPSKPRKPNLEDLPLSAAQVQRIKNAEKVILEEILYSRVQSRDRSSGDRIVATRSSKRPRLQTSRGHEDLRSHNQTKDVSTGDRITTPVRLKIADHRAESPQGVPSARLSKPPSGIKSGDVPSSPLNLALDDALKPNEAWKPPTHRRNLSSTSAKPNIPIRPPADHPAKPPLPVMAVADTTTPKAVLIESLPTVDDFTAEMELKGFDTDVNSLEIELEAYMQKVPIGIRETFWDQAAFRSILKQCYPAFLQVTRGRQRVGTVAFSIDTLTTSTRRVYLHHLSAMGGEDLAKILDMSLKHVWKALPCDEVRIAMNYREIEGKLSADPEIKAIVTERKFKWKNLTNTADGRRIIIMGLARPDEEGYGSRAAEDFFRETFVVKYASGLQLSSPPVPAPASGQSVSSYIGLVACFKELGTIAESPSNPAQEQLKGLLEKLAMTFTFPAYRREKAGDLYQALETIHDQGMKLEGLKHGLITSTACLSVGLRWTSFDTSYLEVDGETYNYLRVTDLEVNQTNLSDLKVYLVPSDDPQFNLLLITSDGGFPDSLDPWDCACSTLSLLTNSEKAFSGTSSEIWIPGFQLEKSSPVLKDLIGAEIEGQGMVASCSETVSIGLEAPIHSMGSVRFRPGEGAVVIRQEFVIGKR